MQSELPWNIAGISPEARDAARAAARREGLSVGEWLSRRIVNGQACATDEELSAWTLTVSEPPRAAEPAQRPSAPEFQDMMARIARSEGETQNTYKIIDQQLKAVARRVETAERTQTENGRAMAQAAAQMNIAAREQAQILEQVTANITALADRLARVERQAAQDGMKEAVKALHHGLSRLTDQIAETASRSTTQMATLTGNIDSLTTRLVETREKADGLAEALDGRLASFDERLRLAERTAFSSASALDHTMENVERLRATQDSAWTETQQQTKAIDQIRQSFDGLNARISTVESDATGAAARLEEALARLQPRHGEDPVEQRLQGIEHVLSDLVSRIEQIEHASANASSELEQRVRDLAAGLEAADGRDRNMIERLQATAQENAAKIAVIESSISTAEAEKPAEPVFDLPEFPDTPASQDSVAQFSPPPFPFEDPVPQHGPASDFRESVMDLDSPQSESGGSYLAAARQAARGADNQTAPRASMGDFAWTFGRKENPEPPAQGAKRYLMAGSIFGVAVAAALTGVVLTRGAGSTPPHIPFTTTNATHVYAAKAAPVRLGAPPVSASASKFADDDAPSQPGARLSAPSPNASSNRVQPSGVRLASANLVAAAHPSSPAPAKMIASPPHTVPVLASVSASAPSTSVVQRLTALANTGDSKGQLLLGLKYLSGSGVAANEAEAARWLARAAQQGEPLAQYRLGTLYERGRGVPVDGKQATHWYELAAKQGNRKAMHNLAVAFAEGTGEPKDPAQAAVWFGRAANLGLADSQFNLAVLYERGMGVQQSLVDAYKWYLIAAAQGDAESKKRAEALATQLSDGDRSTAQRAAAAFKPQEPNPAANSAPALG